MTSDDLEKERARVYGALSHPTRMGIIKLLGEKETSSFTEFKRALRVGDGKLYYHLGMLKAFVAQDEAYRYHLTERGRMAHRLLTSNEEMPAGALLKGPRGGWAGRLYGYLSAFLSPSWLLAYLFTSPIRNAVELFLLVLVGSWMAGVSGLRPALLIFTHAPPGYPQHSIMLEFIAGWLIVYALTDVLSTPFGRGGGHLRLLVGTTFSYVPLVLLAALRMLDRALQWGLAFAYGGIPFRLLLLICQGWSLSLLTLATSLAKRLSLERAATVTLVVAYLNIAYYVVTQGI